MIPVQGYYFDRESGVIHNAQKEMFGRFIALESEFQRVKGEKAVLEEVVVRLNKKVETLEKENKKAEPTLDTIISELNLTEVEIQTIRTCLVDLIHLRRQNLDNARTTNE